MTIIGPNVTAGVNLWSTAVTFSEDRYWELVKDTLEKIFGQSSTKGAADDLRREVAQSPQEEQIIFYHAEPLDVAADLAGEVPNDHQLRNYRDLVKDRFATWGVP